MKFSPNQRLLSYICVWLAVIAGMIFLGWVVFGTLTGIYALYCVNDAFKNHMDLEYQRNTNPGGNDVW